MAEVVVFGIGQWAELAHVWFRAIPQHSRWIVEYDQVAVATLNLADVDREHRTGNWGFYVADQNYRRRGIRSYC